tara:strand:+ start:3323 stop:3730 length:408 start_codon:yes stop_codon:yes gene_type:complete
MTTENTGSPHDPDYNISVSSSPDKIRQYYVPPAGSVADQTYDPNKIYPDGAYVRSLDPITGAPDPEYMWPDDSPNRTEMMLHRISEGFNNILLKLDSVEETKATVAKQEEKIEQILVLLEATLREFKTIQIKNKD